MDSVPNGPIGPETINIEITTADVGSATFQMCFYLNGDSYSINYWYVDDVMLTGAGILTLDPPANLAIDENSFFTWDAPVGGGDIEELIYDNGASNGQYSYVGYSMGTNAGNNIISKTELTGNYPNPFNPETNIAYSVKETGNVTLEVYNLRGQLVKTLVNGVIESGDQIVTWNGTNDSGKTVASGVYFYKMKADMFIETKKMILMK